MSHRPSDAGVEKRASTALRSVGDAGPFPAAGRDIMAADPEEVALSDAVSIEEAAARDDFPVALARTFAHLDPIALGVACGLAGGIGLMFGTLALVVRGGPNMGYHLWMLAQYLRGYEVSWGGSLVGFLYGAGLGFLAGYAVATVRNALAVRYLRRAYRRAERESLGDLLDRLS